MYGFNIHHYDHVTIYSYFFGKQLFINTKYKSILPDRSSKDTDASFNLYIHNHRVYWNDFGHSKNKGTDVIGFVASLLGLSRNAAHYVIATKAEHYKKGDSDTYTKKEKVHVYVRSEWCLKDAEYWKPTGVRSFKDLERLNIWPLQDYYINNYLMGGNHYGTASYIYIWPQGTKAYNTQGPYPKFVSKILKQHIQGLDLVTTRRKNLIITKSYKDAITLMFMGFNAIAPHGEKITFEDGFVDVKWPV